MVYGSDLWRPKKVWHGWKTKVPVTSAWWTENLKICFKYLQFFSFKAFVWRWRIARLVACPEKDFYGNCAKILDCWCLWCVFTSLISIYFVRTKEASLLTKISKVKGFSCYISLDWTTVSVLICDKVQALAAAAAAAAGNFWSYMYLFC